MAYAIYTTPTPSTDPVEIDYVTDADETTVQNSIDAGQGYVEITSSDFDPDEHYVQNDTIKDKEERDYNPYAQLDYDHDFVKPYNGMITNVIKITDWEKIALQCQGDEKVTVWGGVIPEDDPLRIEPDNETVTFQPPFIDGETIYTILVEPPFPHLASEFQFSFKFDEIGFLNGLSFSMAMWEAKNYSVSKFELYYASDEPASPEKNDLRYHSDTFEVDRYNGSSWDTDITLSNKRELILILRERYYTEGGPIQIFFQNDKPKDNASNDLKKSDLWFDMDDNKRNYRWTGSEWRECFYRNEVLLRIK